MHSVFRAHARDAALLQPLDGVLGPRSAVDQVADPEQPVVRGVEAQGLERFLERVEVPVQVSGDQIASAPGVRLVVHDRLGRPDPLHASTVRGHCESSQRLRCIFRISSITAQTSTDKRERRHLGRERENHGIMLLDADATIIDGVQFVGATPWTDFLPEQIVANRRPTAQHATSRTSRAGMPTTAPPRPSDSTSVSMSVIVSRCAAPLVR